MQNSKMRVLIGGGTGFIGKHIARKLADKGHEVTLLSRSTGRGRLTWDELYKKGLPDNTGAVVNVAGENALNMFRRGEAYKKDIITSRVDTTKALAEAITASKNPPKVFVSTSAIGYYPPSSVADYTEDTKVTGIDFPSKLCQDWEEAAVLPEGKGVRRVTIRLGVVLGKDGGAIKQMWWQFYFGAGGKIGTGRQFFPWIHIDDASGLFVYSIENDHVSGILNAVAPQICTNEEFTKAFAGAMRRPAFMPFPAFAANLIFQDRATMLLDGQKVIPKRTLELGYKFKYSHLDDACKEIVS
ncbi:epimerase family protein SDR39U1 [Lingula anatina]|uniref:Epimerase family protein SDR39U1 n=1 Tax=Lingula anatina TaxID=7574 RepID=A0A1S3H071_LINAN|nr:epimerase family protein SDR39U1 [Lingula anatina]|eukprot:XP_013379327.1 epimerase family protein SDR39U1 [Lingula anatina]